MNKVNVFPVGKKFDESKKKWSKFPKIDKGVSWLDYSASEKELRQSSNIGIVIPRGVMVIDMDVDKGVTHSDIEGILGCCLDWESAELQQTVSGGYHYGFVVNDDIEIKQGSDLFGVTGFDTRASLKGWICSGDGYTTLSMVDVVDALTDAGDWLPDLPAEAVNKLRNDTQEESEIDDLDEAIASEVLDLSFEEIENYLNALEDNYWCNESDWYRVGMAVYHQTKGSEEGRLLFDKISKERGGEHYDEEKNLTRWNSFNSEGKLKRITFASVILWAGGKRSVVSAVEYKTINQKIESAKNTNDLNSCLIEMGKNKINDLNLDMLLKDVQAQFKIVENGKAPSIPALKKIVKSNKPDKNKGSFVDDYVFVQSSGEYLHRENKTTMGPRSFDTTYNRITPLDFDGNSQSATNYSNTLIQCVSNAMYAPMFGGTFTHDYIDYVNLYRPSLVERVDMNTSDIVDRVKGHISHLLEDEEEQQLVIDYLAHNVQYPGKKIQWSIVLQGVQGDGKSFLAEMMQSVMGMHNVRLMNVQTLESSFTGWAAGQCMTFIEELKLDNFRKYEILNNLKPYITNSSVEMTKKGKDPIVVMNTTNYFALTNFKDALPIDDNDRRYCILFSRWQNGEKLKAWSSKNKEYYPQLYTDMRSRPGELLDWLLNHKISNEFLSMNRAPETKAKESMKDLSKSEGYLALEDAITEFECKDINFELLNVTKLSNLIELEWSNLQLNKFPKTSALKNILTDMGFHYVGRNKGTDRKNQRFYAKDENFDISKLEEKAPF